MLETLGKLSYYGPSELGLDVEDQWQVLKRNRWTLATASRRSCGWKTRSRVMRGKLGEHWEEAKTIAE